MKLNLKIVLEIDGRRFELSQEDAAELARQLQALGLGTPTPAPVPWPGPWTYPPFWVGAEYPPPTIQIGTTTGGNTSASSWLHSLGFPEPTADTKAANLDYNLTMMTSPATWEGRTILSEDDLSRMDCPYPPEPEV